MDARDDDGEDDAIHHRHSLENRNTNLKSLHRQRSVSLTEDVLQGVRAPWDQPEAAPGHNSMEAPKPGRVDINNLPYSAGQENLGQKPAASKPPLGADERRELDQFMDALDFDDRSLVQRYRFDKWN